MKKILITLAFLLFPLSAGAQTQLWEMNSFDVDISVREDSVVLIEETIEANFIEPRHGIFRYIPFRGKLDDGSSYKLRVKLIGVTDENGNKYDVKRSKSGDNHVWKIGDPDITSTGEHTYVITYEVSGAIRRFEERDELYWNVSGDGWDVPLPQIKAKVTYPEVKVKEIEATCYYGEYGSENTEECFVLTSPSFAGFGTLKAGDPLTIAVGWPKGTIREPSVLSKLVGWIVDYWPLGIPLIIFIAMFIAWRKYGDDNTGMAIVPEFEAPSGLRPFQMMALMEQKAKPKHLAATIIDLAVRGHLSITEIEKKWVFGKKDYELREESSEDELEKFEKMIMVKLFSRRGVVRVSALQDKFYKEIPIINTLVMGSLLEKNFFEAHPNKARIKWGITGGIFLGFLVALSLVTGAGLFPGFEFIVGISAGIIFIFSYYMPKWTREGAAAYRHAKGFKMFVSKVEKHRTDWMEKENIFEQVLPFAIAMGLGKKWSKAFEGLQTEPPSWYHGGMYAVWSPAQFTKDLTSMTKTFNATATSSPSSRGGSGGRGFSGGGFGGGGGGSW